MTVEIPEAGDLYGRGVEVVSDKNPRCWHCARQFAILLTRPWIVRCPKCKSMNQSGVSPNQPPEAQP